MKSLLFLIISLITIPLSYSQTRNYSNEFLAIGVDAASFGKSNAVVASTGNVNSSYWNPAGLTKLENKQVSLMHASYFANIANYDFGAYAQPLENNSAIALSVVRFGVDDILDTRQLIANDGSVGTRFNDLPRFSSADYAFNVSYARAPFNKNFSYGINAKVVRRIIGDFASSWGFGLDVGLQGKFNKYNYGVIVRDITTTFNSWKIDDDIFENSIEDNASNDAGRENNNNALDAQEIPEKTEITIPSIQAGIARDFTYRRDLIINVEANINMRFAESNDVISSSAFSISPAMGFELGYKRFVFLRGGVGNFQRSIQFDQSEQLTFQPNFGVGFHYKGVSIDYALTDIGDQSAAEFSNIFSLVIDWKVFGR